MGYKEDNSRLEESSFDIDLKEQSRIFSDVPWNWENRNNASFNAENIEHKISSPKFHHLKQTNHND